MDQRLVFLNHTHVHTWSNIQSSHYNHPQSQSEVWKHFSFGCHFILPALHPSVSQSLLEALGLFCSHFPFHPLLKVLSNHSAYRQSTVQVAWCSLTVSSKWLCHAICRRHCSLRWLWIKEDKRQKLSFFGSLSFMVFILLKFCHFTSHAWRPLKA